MPASTITSANYSADYFSVICSPKCNLSHKPLQGLIQEINLIHLEWRKHKDIYAFKYSEVKFNLKGKILDHLDIMNTDRRHLLRSTLIAVVILGFVCILPFVCANNAEEEEFMESTDSL